MRKLFPRNPYSMTNVMDVWECDLVDVQSLGNFNDGHKYILTVIDVFCKYLHMVPLKAQTGAAEASAFQSVLRDPCQILKILYTVILSHIHKSHSISFR